MGVVMGHQTFICQYVPVNAVLTDVCGLEVVLRGRQDAEPAGAVLNHAEEEQLGGAGSLLAANVETMRVPRGSPFGGVLVDGVEKEVMNQPNVPRPIGVEAVRVLELQEEAFPLASEPGRDIIPETLDASVMNAPEHE